MLPQMHATIIVDCPPKPGQLYRLGWNRFFDGLSRTTCENDHERRGWDAANRACAETLTPGYAESMSW